MSARRRGPGRPADDVDRRQELVGAAGRVFLRDGFDASLRAIADEAGVTSAAVYHYFDSKEELLVEAVMGAVGLLDLATLEGEEADDLGAMFSSLTRRYLDIVQREEVLRFALLILSSYERLPEAVRRFGEGLEGVLLPLADRISAEQRAGRVREDVSPTLAVQMLFGSMFTYALLKRVVNAPWLEDVDDELMAATVAGVLGAGLAQE